MLCLLPSFGCYKGKIDPIDATANLSRNDYKRALFADKSKKANMEAPSFAPVPKLSKIISVPKPPKINSDKLITFSITEQVPLKDVLMELGRVAGIDVDIDPNINGSVIISAKNRPLIEVIDRICTMGGVRYTYQDNILHFENDSPLNSAIVRISLI